MSKSFEVCEAANTQHVESWLAAWRSLDVPEVFGHPSYVGLWTQRGEIPSAAIQRTHRGAIVFPFLIRRLALEPWAERGEPASDLASPYGYGGAFGSAGVSDLDWRDFWDAFEAWCRERGVVSSFARLSLFDDAAAPPAATVRVVQRNVVRFLSLDSDATWREYEHKVRKNVNRARQQKLSVTIERAPTTLDDFEQLYRETMTRRGAKPFYFFSEQFFADLVNGLGELCVLATVSDEQGPVSSELLLDSGGRRLYSFLGGTIDRGFPARANDLLKHEVIEWARADGFEAYVLGGGVADGDGIFRYKQSFAPQGIVPFRVAEAAHDPVAIDRLTRDRRAKWGELSTEEAPSFFPPYRRPSDP